MFKTMSAERLENLAVQKPQKMQKRSERCGKWFHSLPEQCVCSHNAFCEVVLNNIIIIEHLPYSSALAPCDIYLFSNVKSVLKRTYFEPVDAVKKITPNMLKELTVIDLLHVFDQWKERIQRCISANGEYIKRNKHCICNTNKHGELYNQSYYLMNHYLMN